MARADSPRDDRRGAVGSRGLNDRRPGCRPLKGPRRARRAAPRGRRGCRQRDAARARQRARGCDRAGGAKRAGLRAGGACRMRILVTNDDGIRSRGLHALAVALEERRHDVVVVAPRDDMSGVGAAIGRIRADQRIETSPSVIPEARSLRVHSIDGPPGLAVMAACLGAFGDVPDIVVSGINAGPNTGHACLHSGTVGAALTAATFGVSALAVSSAVADPMQWQTACALLDEAIGLLEQWGRPSVLNLNAPALPPDEVRGLRWARLDRFGRVRLALAASSDRWLQMEYRAND